MQDIKTKPYNLKLVFPKDFDRLGRIKYQSRNPIMNLLMEQFYMKLLSQISKFYDRDDDFTILDIGCGLGVISAIISQNFPNVGITGFDISKEAIKSAKLLLPSSNLYIGDVYSLPHRKESFDLVISLEILEHLNRPKTVIDSITKICRSHVIFSIPNNWKFRVVNIMRFKYLERKGNTPSHINEWTIEEFSSVISPHFSIIDVSPVMGIWLQFLCVKI